MLLHCTYYLLIETEIKYDDNDDGEHRFATLNSVCGKTCLWKDKVVHQVIFDATLMSLNNSQQYRICTTAKYHSHFLK